MVQKLNIELFEHFLWSSGDIEIGVDILVGTDNKLLYLTII